MSPKVAIKSAILLLTLCLVVMGQPANAAAASQRVGDVRAKAMQIRVDKPSGATKWVAVTKRTRVVLKDRSGTRTRADLNELSRGARIVGKTVRDGRLARVVLKEKSTGSADCSFDSSEDDGDSVSNDSSFDCSNDYDDGELETDSDCSYDASSDGPAFDWSMSASWDCSYSESDEGETDGLDWDCSYSASADGSEEEGSGDVGADLDFDCSWDGASTESVLWDCRFLPGVLGFRCSSAQLGQDFHYTIDLESKQFVGGMDFSKDLVKEGVGEDGVDCSGSAAGTYDCSFDGESESGDCDVDWSFDRSRARASGDVSGSLSYSCSW